MQESYIVFLTLLGTLGLFIWGFWRYDIVACIALLTLVLFQIIPASNAFSGFSNPAVITVACVMIITAAITQSGIIDYAVKRLTPVTQHAVLHVLTLGVITALLSAFMNNVGALALMMPVAIQTAIKSKRSPAMVLMPLAFSSVLGGLTTAIGTPPNLLISAYRETATGHAFAMFDFAPVGIIIAVVSILFIALMGWRLIPYKRKAPSQSIDMFQMQDYFSEIRVPDISPFVNKSLLELEKSVEGDFSVVGLIRGKRKRFVLQSDEILQEKDILIIEASHDDLEKLVHAGRFEIVGGEVIASEQLRAGNVGLVEAVVSPGSRLEGRSWQGMRIRSRFRTNLLAIAREGRPYKKRLNHVNLHAGDVVLLQGDLETIQENVFNLGLLPLVERGVQVGMPRRAFMSIIIFAIAITLTATRILPVQVSFAVTVLMFILFKIIPVRNVYKNIDWSIIVLLAAMIPIGDALQSTGGTKLIANLFMMLAGNAAPIFIFGLLLVVTMTLSDVMNNAATAVVMAPIAVSIADAMQASVDPFLMTVAIGASCSFLTPISHQNNTLVMGPGGYKFGDYIRLGLPVEAIVLIVGLPMILWIWPI